MLQSVARVQTCQVDDTSLALGHAIGFSDVDGAVHTPAAVTSQAVRASRIAVSDYLRMQAAFDDLAGRAALANPFMSPAMVGAAAMQPGATDIVVLVVHAPTDPARLVGVWCLRHRRSPWSMGIEVLQSPLIERYDCLASPVLDQQHQQAALDAMIAHVATAADLPGLICATSWPTALDPLLPGTHRITHASKWQRAMLAPAGSDDAQSYLKQSLGKALRKRDNRQKQLEALGHLDIVTSRGAQAVDAFEHYVTLEARGWKGQLGTSLAEVPGDAAYMRAAIRSLAAADRVAVDMLQLDGKPIACGVVIEAGGNNLFWKAAFDEDFARYAPGSMLHLAVTRRLFQQGRAALDSGMMDFSSADFMPWSERAEMARMTIDCRGGLAGRLVSFGATVRHATRRLKHRLAR